MKTLFCILMLAGVSNAGCFIQSGSLVQSGFTQQVVVPQQFVTSQQFIVPQSHQFFAASLATQPVVIRQLNSPVFVQSNFLAAPVVAPIIHQPVVQKVVQPVQRVRIGRNRIVIR